MSSDRNTLFFNHFHSPRSNSYVMKYSDSKYLGQKAINHFGSPIKILKGLQSRQKAVINLTEHFQTNPRKFFEGMVQAVEEIGGSGSIQNQSVLLELKGAEMKIINGVEATYRGEGNHVILGGVPIEKEVYILENKQDLKNALEKAEYAHPAHPFFGDFGIEKEKLFEICRTIKESSAQLFIPYTTAYGHMYDEKTRGFEESEIDIEDLSEKFSAPYIVEQDHHVHLPSGMNGVALLENSATEEVPIQELKEARIIKPKKSDTLRDQWRIGRTYADQLPGYLDRTWFWKIINTPYSMDQFRKYRDKYYSLELGNLDFEELNRRSRNLN
jgi:hypothetical protein